ncbi:hypothetical protein UFOVP313_27 [uncultured Caudovirales phage]|uniref:DUF6745 domain-containing protein n=1 Tax=uncultured Caudovirales phage TaxID=2100421 RepID=A0A6J5LQW0_9CAUD|nr:hypothetical protein UFOVP313_27 [uncultured Caudovirales phage]
MSSTKLEKLTPEQQAHMVTVRDEWLRRAFSGFNFDEEAAREGIEWIYSLCDLPAPQFIFVSSPFAAQIAANMLIGKEPVRVWELRGPVREQVRLQVWEQMGAQVQAQVREQVLPQVQAQVEDKVWQQVWEQVWELRAQVREQVRLQVWEQMGAQVQAQVEDKVLAQVRAQVVDKVSAQVGQQVREPVWEQVLEKVWGQATYYRFANVCWNFFGWTAWAQFFKDIGIQLTEAIEPFLKFQRSNCFDFIAFEGLCIVCEPPSVARRDERFRLSSDESACIEWRDGYKLWAIDGVFFDEVFWNKVVKKELTAKDLLGIENIEQRMIALKYAGADETLAAMNAKLLNKSMRGNELYLVENFFEEEPLAYFLKYACPSTGRVYLSGIDPSFLHGNDPDACMAWKHRITLLEYNELRCES